MTLEQAIKKLESASLTDDLKAAVVVLMAAADTIPGLEKEIQDLGMENFYLRAKIQMRKDEDAGKGNCWPGILSR